jgi:hypothetical protein
VPTAVGTPVPRLGAQDRGQGAPVGTTAGLREKPIVGVVRQRRKSGSAKVIVSWALLGAVVLVGVKLYPRLREELTLDHAKVTQVTGGVQVADGAVTFRMPSRPKAVLVHPAGDDRGITGFRVTLAQGTLEVDVKNTVSRRTPAALQRFCDLQIQHRTSVFGPAITDQSSYIDGLYHRAASWHDGEQVVTATCVGQSHSDVLVEARSVQPHWAAYTDVVNSVAIN